MKKAVHSFIVRLLFTAIPATCITGCGKADTRGYGPNECRTCTAYYESGMTAGSSATVCNEADEQSYRQEYNYAFKVECKK